MIRHSQVTRSVCLELAWDIDRQPALGLLATMTAAACSQPGQAQTESPHFRSAFLKPPFPLAQAALMRASAA